MRRSYEIATIVGLHTKRKGYRPAGCQSRSSVILIMNASPFFLDAAGPLLSLVINLSFSPFHFILE